VKRAIIAIVSSAFATARPTPERINGLRVIDVGSGSVPVVFLHGGCGDAETWRAQIDHLRGSHRVVAYDQRGHGASERADRYTLDLLADDVDALAGALRLGRFWLVGHSMSGAVLLTYAGKHPEKLAGLVFVDAVGDFSNAPPEMKKWFADPGPGFGVPQMQSMFGEMLGDKAKPSTREAVLASVAKCDPRAFVQLREELIARSTAPGLARFTGPKFAVDAEGPDNPFLASSLPGVKRKVMANVSHWLMLDDPAATNAALDEVLAP
jgi:pimeloyl-ACP methyl ester carboxylesterase